MPATAGRVRMPHNNRVHGSSALNMTGIWKNTIGYDPYAAEGEEADGPENSYEQAQGLMELVKLSTKGVSENRGLCRKCGLSGHLPFQCRNHLKATLPTDHVELSDSDEEDQLLVGLHEDEAKVENLDVSDVSDVSSVSSVSDSSSGEEDHVVDKKIQKRKSRKRRRSEEKNGEMEGSRDKDRSRRRHKKRRRNEDQENPKKSRKKDRKRKRKKEKRKKKR